MGSASLRRLLAVSLCIAALVACSDDDAGRGGNATRGDGNEQARVPTNWDTYTDADTGFRFAMPRQPEVLIDAVPQADGTSLEVTLHVVELGRGLVLVGLGPVPSNHDLDSTIDRAAGDVRGTIVERSTTTVEGHDARDAEATFESGGVAGLMLTRVLAIDDTLVQISTIGAADAEGTLRPRHAAMLAGFEY
jgi:hypothetical protein